MDLITKEQAQNILSGSLFLGCGGGGSGDIGQDIIDKTDGKVSMMSMEEAKKFGPDALFITISGVGSPASKESYCGDAAYSRIVEITRELQKANPSLPQGEIRGLIPSEMGAASSFGPFMTSAQLGIPVINTACDGRAHPFGSMGSLGLQTLPKPVIQVACGGDPKKNRYLEVSVIAAVDPAAEIIRTSASNAGGLVEVARNPVDYPYLERTSAIDCYSLAEAIGQEFNEKTQTEEKLKRVCAVVKGDIIAEGTVGPVTIETKNALDYGHLEVIGPNGKFEMYFCNEYMAVNSPDGVRLFTFPDLIVTANLETGRPLSTAELKEGDKVCLLGSSWKNMILGLGVRYRAPYKRLEDALEIEMIKYLDGLFVD
ncbi:MAG: DUF917 family protein [Oscillospiraceae bacterium]|nr:DUF917 family protein [Oscillospiraceae bacterium]